ncbi:MAG TPA: hypothetical protein PLN54_14195, partial [Flavobacteriales bacterium]|nr:hypothetical protein [Flavobacteriales bacterium]
MAKEKSNRLREDRTEEAAPKKRSRANGPAGEGRWARFKAFLADERTHKVAGLFLVLLSAYLL